MAFLIVVQDSSFEREGGWKERRECRAAMSPAKRPPEPPDTQNDLQAPRNHLWPLCLSLRLQVSAIQSPRPTHGLVGLMAALSSPPWWEGGVGSWKLKHFSSRWFKLNGKNNLLGWMEGVEDFMMGGGGSRGI